MFDVDRYKQEVIADPRHADFFEQVRLAPHNLQENQAPGFFKTVLGHCRGDLSIKYKKPILQSIYAVISIPRFRTPFVTGCFAEGLPFSDPEIVDDILNILWVLACQAPDSFDPTLCHSLKAVIHLRPLRYLQLVPLFSKDFNTLRDPWPFIDLLFTECELFSAAETCIKYGSVLGYLVVKYERFRDSRGEDAFQTVFALLDSPKVDILSHVYESLCLMAEFVLRIDVPFDIIKDHLKIEELHNCILNFFLVIDLQNLQKLNDPVFYRRLIRIGVKERRATLVLMRIADSDPIFAQSLAVVGVWMEKGLPDVVSTLQLFLVVFKNKDVRPEIARDPGFVTFLNNLVGANEPKLNFLALKILRRIEDIPPKLVSDLSETGFISKFAEFDRTEEGRKDYLLLLVTLGKCDVTREIISGCKKIKSYIREGDIGFGDSCLAAVELARQPKCAKLFKELGLVEIFRKLRKNPHTKVVAAQFLQVTEEDRADWG
jgi:hypothetical protein